MKKYPNEYDRFLDLQKQGFMRMVNKPVKQPKKVKTPLPMVACDACMDWHLKGKHVASKEDREARIKELKEKNPNYVFKERIIGDNK